MPQSAVCIGDPGAVKFEGRRGMSQLKTGESVRLASTSVLLGPLTNRKLPAHAREAESWSLPSVY